MKTESLTSQAFLGEKRGAALSYTSALFVVQNISSISGFIIRHMAD
jgi:hypothetical protein